MGHHNTPNDQFWVSGDQFRVSGVEEQVGGQGAPKLLAGLKGLSLGSGYKLLPAPGVLERRAERDQRPLFKKQAASRSTGLEQTSPLGVPHTCSHTVQTLLCGDSCSS